MHRFTHYRRVYPVLETGQKHPAALRVISGSPYACEQYGPTTGYPLFPNFRRMLCKLDRGTFEHGKGPGSDRKIPPQATRPQAPQAPRGSQGRLMDRF